MVNTYLKEKFWKENKWSLYYSYILRYWELYKTEVKSNYTGVSNTEEIPFLPCENWTGLPLLTLLFIGFVLGVYM